MPVGLLGNLALLKGVVVGWGGVGGEGGRGGGGGASGGSGAGKFSSGW